MAKLVAKVLLLCATGAAGLADADFKERPVMKVVRLLQDMKAELQKDLDDDKAVHEQLDCWCKSNDKDKTAAIEFGDAKESQLTSYLGEAAAKMDELKTKRDATLDEVNKDEASLQEASTLRMKENQEFHAEEVNLVEAVKACDQAVTVLGKHNAGFAQVRAIAQQLQAAQVMELGRHSVQPSDMLALRSFLLKAQDSSPSFLQIPGFQSYAPQSNQIFGVLQQMQEEFEGNLAQSQEGEKKAQEDFTGLKAALETEIETSSAKLDELEADFGANTKALSDAKEDLTSTREQRSEDVTFLSDLNLKCKDLDHQYQQRSKARGEEIRAVGDAVKILTEDDARTLFQKNMGTGSTFLQIAATSKEDRMRVWASAMLLRVADKLRASAGRSWIGASAPHEQLTAVALQVQLDAFTEVKKAIDVMVAELKTQMKAEVDHKAFCTKSLGENEKETYHTKETLEDITDHIAALEDAIQKLQDEIAQAHEAITNMEVQLKAAGELRKQENAEFQEEVMDQRTMQQILDKAIKRMKLVYKESLLQEEPAPPVQFQPHKESSGGSLVIGLMEQIVEDSKTAEAETAAAEQAAQTAYSEFVNDSESAIRGLNKAIEEKTKVKAQTEVERSDEESAKLNTEDKLESLEAFAADMHAQCDFVLKNFDVRQTARLQEIEALGNVKVLLSGMTADNASR
mmetsp:Transcript_46931/g.125542  ORF Transcript_46931/g.125542 Transcript_46931/m.125542 type:complete len:685 (+) Transcript_46931:110-2164(+)